MKEIHDDAELRRWTDLAGEDPEMPFENVVTKACAYFSFSDYAALFLPETIRAACMWSMRNHSRSFALFFSIPDAASYAEETGSCGGLVTSGVDDVLAIESFLTHNNRSRPFLSPYDVSHRFFIVPEDRSWLWAGDRDADLAIFGFSTVEEQDEFRSEAGFQMFASVDDAELHAKSLMGYSLDRSRFKRA